MRENEKSNTERGMENEWVISDVNRMKLCKEAHAKQPRECQERSPKVENMRTFRCKSLKKKEYQLRNVDKK